VFTWGHLKGEESSMGLGRAMNGMTGLSVFGFVRIGSREEIYTLLRSSVKVGR
jgi:hypothetical protein